MQHPQSKVALVNGRVILPGKIVRNQALIIEGTEIVGLTHPGALEPTLEMVDVGGRYIIPGLIDIHIHGASGHTFNEIFENDFTPWRTMIRGRWVYGS